jgi:TrkA domain protein
MSSPDAGPHVHRLPGVGSSLDLTDADGRPLQAVRLRDGSVELFAHPTDGSVSLDPAAAASLGAFVSGHYLLRPDVSERIGDVLGGLVFDWVELGAEDHAVGRTIQELEVRRRTGVTVVAVLRGPTAVVAPEPDLRFERGDELVFACGPQDRDDFERFLQTGR